MGKSSSFCHLPRPVWGVGDAMFIVNTTKVIVQKNIGQNYLITKHKPFWPNEATNVWSMGSVNKTKPIKLTK